MRCSLLPGSVGRRLYAPGVAVAAKARGLLFFRGTRDTLLGVAVGVIAFALLFGARSLFHQDAWLALVAGREIWHSGIPHHDTLTTLTEGRRWIDQQWLSQLAVYALYRVGGLSLVSVVHVGLVVGSVAAAIAIGRRRGSTLSTQLLILFVGILLVLLPSLAVRTQPYAYPLFVATVYLLSSDSRSPSRAVYWTLPLLVLWANVHGSAALARGDGVAAGHHHPPGGEGTQRAARSRPAGRWLPHGRRAAVPARDALWRRRGPSYYRDTLLNPDFTRLVAEWRPVTDNRPAAVAFFALAGLAVWSVGRWPGRLNVWSASSCWCCSPVGPWRCATWSGRSSRC